MRKPGSGAEMMPASVANLSQFAGIFQASSQQETTPVHEKYSLLLPPPRERMRALLALNAAIPRCGSHPGGRVFLFTMSNSAVSRFPGRFLPELPLTLRFALFLSSTSAFHFSFLVSPASLRGRISSFPPPPIKGVEERRQTPGCRVRTRIACHDRHAGHQTRRRAPELRGLASGAPPWRFLVRATHCRMRHSLRARAGSLLPPVPQAGAS